MEALRETSSLNNKGIILPCRGPATNYFTGTVPARYLTYWGPHKIKNKQTTKVTKKFHHFLVFTLC